MQKKIGPRDHFMQEKDKSHKTPSTPYVCTYTNRRPTTGQSSSTPQDDPYDCVMNTPQDDPYDHSTTTSFETIANTRLQIVCSEVASEQHYKKQ